MAKTSENWMEMTPEQKRADRLENFSKSGQNVQFVSPEAEKNYEIRIKRLLAVYNLQKPDRVPLNINAGNLPLTMAALSQAPVIALFSHVGFQDAADGPGRRHQSQDQDAARQSDQQRGHDRRSSLCNR